MSNRAAIDREALRALIRQVLRDAVPADLQKKLSAALAKKSGATPAITKAKSAPAFAEDLGEEVLIASDADLNSFVQRLLAMADDGATREALKSGQRKFRLARKAGRLPATPRHHHREENHRPVSSQGGASRSEGNRIDRGLVAERHIVAAAKNGKKLTVAKGVAVTPLARDKARQLGVVIERE
jgi:hypothetical protein